MKLGIMRWELKKITPSDVSLVLRRQNWAAGDVYPEFDSFDCYEDVTDPTTKTTTLRNNPIVMNSGGRVYLVLKQ